MIDIRPATEEEMGALGTLTGYVYGGAFGFGPESMSATANRAEWSLCAFDGDRLAASFVTIPFTMRMNGNPMSYGGVSAVATDPEYRRRGLMRRLMTQATADMRERGQSIAGLWASQAAIYQRFGYAIGSYRRDYRIDTVDIAFHDGDPGLGRVEWLDAETAFDAVRALYIDFVADRTGYLHRSRPLWASGPFDVSGDEGPVNVALSRDADGSPNGYLVYTLRAGGHEHRSRAQRLVVRDLVWLTSDAYRSLWSYIARHDLVGEVVWEGAPVDDPAEELLAEPRLLTAQDHEGAWFRVVDVEPALAGRGYSSAGQLTIAVAPDDLTPWNEGIYTVETDGNETAVERVSSAGSGRIDVTLSVKALASLFCGMRSARRLKAWGLLEGDDDAVGRCDALLATVHLPHTPDHY